MADPTIQTFCCHEPRNDTGINLMMNFNTNTYNTVGLVSSSIGILGAIYQILPRQDPSQTHRWFAAGTRGRQIVVWLAVADLMASLGVFTRSALWINHKREMLTDEDTTSVLFCAISSAWIQYFYTATWLWTLCYAIDIRLVLKERPGWPGTYHLVAWTVPALLTTGGLALLYLPDANCHVLGSLSEVLYRILPNYIATYLPLAIVMVVCPWLYVKSSAEVKDVVACGMGQYTGKERSLVDSIRIKFAFINIALYVCWLPNLVNSVLLWTLWFNLPRSAVVSLWYLMAATNPLQAAFNSLVYRSWSGSDKVYNPCRGLYSLTPMPLSSSTPSPANEATPLLQAKDYGMSAKCINGSSNDE